MTKPETGFIGGLGAFAIIAAILAGTVAAKASENHYGEDAPALLWWAQFFVMLAIASGVGALVLGGVRDLLHKMLSEVAQPEAATVAAADRETATVDSAPTDGTATSTESTGIQAES